MTKANVTEKMAFRVARYVVILCLGVSASGGAFAAPTLINEGNGTVLDPSTGLLWLQDVNYFFTEFSSNPNIVNDIITNIGTINGHTLTASDFRSDGVMDWWGAMAWAQNLDVGGLTGWRLPTITEPDPTCSSQTGSGYDDRGTNCTGSELGYLYSVDMGVSAENDITSSANTGNLDVFTNVEGNEYASSTEYALLPGYAWVFNTGDGIQFEAPESNVTYLGWAVRPVGNVPEPATLMLVCVGIAGLGFFRRMNSWLHDRNISL
jgi:hypothetical protein